MKSQAKAGLIRSIRAALVKAGVKQELIDQAVSAGVGKEKMIRLKRKHIVRINKMLTAGHTVVVPPSLGQIFTLEGFKKRAAGASKMNDKRWANTRAATAQDAAQKQDK